jgi:hypothetical protein
VSSLAAIENLDPNSASSQSPRPAGNFRNPNAAERERPTQNVPEDRTGLAGAATPEVIAHSVEFVAWPGKARELQTLLPAAMQSAFTGCPNFSGCLVLFPEQEARLVTVVTLWKGEGRAKKCEESSKRVEQMLFPYIEHWLRTRRLAAFLCMR